MYRILIAGCGYTGTKIASYFASKKQKVWGLTRSPEKAENLGTSGIAPLICDITRPETLTEIPPVHFVVLSAAPDERSPEAYESIYYHGVRNLLNQLMKTVPRLELIVSLSSTGVYRDFGGERIDENTPPEPDSLTGKILLRSEELVLNSGMPSVIFRLAGIYGPGRNILKRLAGGGNLWEKDGYLNMIHVDDIVAAMPVLFNKAEPGKVYLGVDDEPVLRSEFLKWLKGDSPPWGLSPLEGKRISNQRLKSLGVALKYPTFREGYTEILRLTEHGSRAT